MTVNVTAPPSEQGSVPSGQLTRGQLPVWAPWAILGASAVLTLPLFWVVSFTNDSSLNIAGWAVTAVLMFLVLVYVISRIVEGHRKALDRLVTGIVATAFGVAMLPLISVSYEVIRLGIARMDVEFFTSSMRNIDGEGGGALHAITGTLLITGMAALISIPVGVMTAIYPIVAGLFAYALFALFFFPGIRMGFMGAVALAVLMTPVVVRSTEEMLRLVPNELREASYALGVPKWLTIAKVVLPTAIAGITTGVMLAIARVIGETAPLLITAGFTHSMNYNLFDGRMQTLPVFTYTQYMNQGIPQFAYVDRAWAAALTLIVIVMALNLLARLIARFFAPKTNR